jgi:hypothetical protein
MLIILFLIIILILIILLSTLKVHVIYSKIQKKDKMNLNYTLHFLNKIKIFDYKHKKKIAKKTIINFKFIDLLKFDLTKYKKVFKINISKFNLYMNIGLENPILASYLVCTIASIVPAIMNMFMKKISEETAYYKINPVFNQNYLELNFDCIIEIKIVHIIHMIYFLLREGRKNERSSNTRTYGYSYAKH